MVAMWLGPLPSSSSQVTISRLLWCWAQAAYPLRCDRSQESPVATAQSCMSLHRLGMTNDTAGSFAKGVWLNFLNDWLTEPGTLVKSAHGTCFLA
jgi:hypothetical protein